MNQFATPGLGTLMAGRLLNGLGQLTLSLVGFALVLAWFVLTLTQAYNQITLEVPARPQGWIGLTGLGIFLTAWLWALPSSLSLLREAENTNAMTPVPPRIVEQPQNPAQK
jgi:hypothetical protein